MSTLLNSKAGKATPAKPQNFFTQFIALPPVMQGAPWQISGITESGIPMRDYFAAKAMATLLAELDSDLLNFAAIARDSYRMADRMIEAREAKENNSQFHEDYQGNGK